MLARHPSAVLSIHDQALYRHLRLGRIAPLVEAIEPTPRGAGGVERDRPERAVGESHAADWARDVGAGIERRSLLRGVVEVAELSHCRAWRANPPLHRTQGTGRPARFVGSARALRR